MANELPIDAFRSLTDNALQGVMIHRGDHRPAYINRAWAELHGRTVDEVMAMPDLFDLIHESERERLVGYAGRRLTGGDAPIRYRYRALHKSGRPIWLEQFAHVFDWSGTQFIQSTIIDVDDQERQTDELRQQRLSMKQEALQKTEALDRSNRQLHVFRSIIDQMSERISVIGRDYRYRYTNRANAEFRQHRVDDLMGRHICETVGDVWFEQVAKGMLDRTFAGETVMRERRVRSPNGAWVDIESTSEPFRDPDGVITGAIVSIRDVTATRTAEDQLRLFASAIEQVSDRISVIGTDYRYRLTNKSNRDYHQMPIEAFLNRPLVDVLGEESFYARSKAELDRCFLGETVRAQRTDRDATGKERVFDIVLEPYRESDGSISGAVVSLRDVTEAQRMSASLAYQARYDQLTGLVNRRALEQLLEASIREASGGGWCDALCFIDLDQFKIVNDTVGHLVGDQLLKEVAKLLSARLNQDDVLARLGGDEFALLLRRCSLRRAKRAAEQLITALKSFQFFHEDLMFEVGASIGITAINRHVSDISDAMAQADLACYAAKDLGRNQVQIFQKRDVVLRRRREDMYRAGGIRAALDKDRFVLFSQPIVRVDADDCPQPEQFEILLRMRDERGQLIMPSAFIPAAERYGFMAQVDRWVIGKTFGELVRRPSLPARPRVNINLSGVTLNDETSLDFIRRMLTVSDLLPEQVTFEITETAAIRNIINTQAFMDELRAWGCRFALDDFGSGLSSLSYLKRLPVEFLKIDGSFVRDVAKDHGSQVMVKAISQMAQGLGIQSVAEGVEDLSTLEILKDIGIDYAQGFATGRPVPLCENERAPISN